MRPPRDKPYVLLRVGPASEIDTSGMRENSAPEDHEPQRQVRQERSRALAVEQVPGGCQRRRLDVV